MNGVVIPVINKAVIIIIIQYKDGNCFAIWKISIKLTVLLFLITSCSFVLFVHSNVQNAHAEMADVAATLHGEWDINWMYIALSTSACRKDVYSATLELPTNEATWV